MWFNSTKYEYVNGLKVKRNTEKPWICTTVNHWWEDLFFPTIWPRQFIDTKHPTWKEHIHELSNKPSAKNLKEIIRKNNATNRCTPN